MPMGDPGEGYASSGGYPGGTGGPLGDPNIGPAGNAPHVGPNAPSGMGPPHGVLGFGGLSPGGYNSTTFNANFARAMAAANSIRNPVLRYQAKMRLKNKGKFQKKPGKRSVGGWPAFQGEVIAEEVLPKEYTDRIPPEQDLTGGFQKYPDDMGGWLGGGSSYDFGWNAGGSMGGLGSPWGHVGGGVNPLNRNKDPGRIAGLQGFAYGGEMQPGQLGVVGEAGPELVQAGPGGAQVAPNPGVLQTAINMTPQTPLNTSVRTPEPGLIPAPMDAFRQSLMNWKGQRPVQAPDMSPEAYLEAIRGWRGAQPQRPREPIHPFKQAIMNWRAQKPDRTVVAPDAWRQAITAWHNNRPVRDTPVDPNPMNSNVRQNPDFNWGSTNLARRNVNA